jgi:4-hydroxy-tetrahydrodipicolinate reductase
MSQGRRVVLVGLGGVGRHVAALLAERPDDHVVAAWSRRPDHHGASLADVAAGAADGVRVSASLDEALAAGADIAVVATASRLRDIADQLRGCVAHGLDVVTTSEEAAQPWATDRELAVELDAAARERGVTLLGAGVNPGFVFDALVLTLTGAASRVDRIEVERVVDLGRFSPAVQRRIGIGHTPESFAAGRASGEITGHIGFPQSMRVVAHALGRELERIESTIEPTLTDAPVSGGLMPVAAGQSAGFVQRYVGYVDGAPWFEARLTGHVDFAAAGLTQRDEIWLHGQPPLHQLLDPGLDAQATVTAVIANSLARLRAAPPGWLTVADLPPARPGGPRRPQPGSDSAPGGEKDAGS